MGVLMKKILTVGGTIIFSLLITFIFAEIFSLYHFGTIPTLLTLLYLISLFSLFEYILLSLIYIVRKIINKEKIKINEIIGRILFFISLILILVFVIVIDIDWLNWYVYSSPFYINVIVRSMEFLLPSIILIIVSICLTKKQK